MLREILILGEYLEYIRLNTLLENRAKVKFIITGLKGVKANLEQIPELEEINAEVGKQCAIWIERLSQSYKDRENEQINLKDACKLFEDIETWRQKILLKLGRESIKR
ncbi:MAG: hypothetical protein QXJ68_03015 [Methanocellales archaeon]